LGTLSNAFADLYRGKVASASGMPADALARAFKSYKNKEWKLKNAVRDSARISVDALRNCLEILAETGRRLGEACANFTAFSSPEAFIFFGGPTKAGELLMSHVRKAYDENVLFVYKGKAKLLVSELDGASAAVLGASALGWEI
jgi:predicted NBD/HSP70 family sugar kinase